MSLERHRTAIAMLKAGRIFIARTKIRLCPPPHFLFTHNVWADLANAAAIAKNTAICSVGVGLGANLGLHL